MLDLYTAYRQCIRRLFRIPARTHNLIVIKLAGDLVSRPDCKIAKFSFTMVNYNNDTMCFITRSKLSSPKSIIDENYRYYLYVVYSDL